MRFDGFATLNNYIIDCRRVILKRASYPLSAILSKQYRLYADKEGKWVA